MAIMNTSSEWTGNYFYIVIDTEELRIIDNFYMRNENNFELDIRCGFIGSNGFRVVTTDPVIIPANSDWNTYGQNYGLNNPLLFNLTVLNDTSGMTTEEVFDDVKQMFQDVIEVRFIHNQSISYEGKSTTGTLQIDYIESIELLSLNQEEKLDFKFYPNPVKELLTLKFLKFTLGTITIYNILGEKVLFEPFSDLKKEVNLSTLQSGIYMVNITTGNSSVTKKVIKL